MLYTEMKMPVDVMNCLVPPEILGKVHTSGKVIKATQMTTEIAAIHVEINRN